MTLYKFTKHASWGSTTSHKLAQALLSLRNVKIYWFRIGPLNVIWDSSKEPPR